MSRGNEWALLQAQFARLQAQINVLNPFVGTPSRAVVTNASGDLVSSTVTTTELNVLTGLTATTAELNFTDGVTSAIQTQLNNKQATITGGATTITSSDLTASRALVSNASGKVAVSAVTSTELSRLGGVTSAIQTQLNAKKPNNSVRGASVSITPVANAATSGNVSWGVTMPNTPFVTVTANSSANTVVNTQFTAVSTTGCTVWIHRTNTTVTTLNAIAVSNT